MFRTTNARNDQVQVVNSSRIDLYQGTGKDLGLFLVIPLENNPVATGDEGFKGFDDSILWKDGSLRPALDFGF